MINTNKYSLITKINKWPTLLKLDFQTMQLYTLEFKEYQYTE